MIREHPRFQKTAMIFISAIQVSDIDRLRGYEMGAVDYVPVPVVPEVLRAKIRVFAELYRKTRQLERLNAELEHRGQGAHRGARGIDLAAGRKRAAPQHGDRRRQDGIVGLGLGQWRLDVGRGPVPDLRRRSADFRGDLGQCAGPAASRRRPQAAQGAGALRQGRAILRDGIPHQPAGRRDALVRRHRGGDHRQGRPRGPRQRRHRRHHRTQARRGAPEPVDPRGRSSRQERAGAGAIDRAADAGAGYRRLCARGGRPHQRAGADSHHPVAVELAGRGDQSAGRRGARALCGGRPDQGQRLGAATGARHRADAGAGVS